MSFLSNPCSTSIIQPSAFREAQSSNIVLTCGAMTDTQLIIIESAIPRQEEFLFFEGASGLIRLVKW